MRFINKQQILSTIYHYGFLYPTPSNLTYFWNFGSLAGLALGIQIVTGIALTFWYIGSVDLAFASVEFIMREVNFGWLIRYLHANGASLFFVVVYLHMGRGLFFGSYVYPREKLWMSGVIIFLVMIITAFLGYVLPWGQMSYWAATVITSLLSVIPIIGMPLLFYVWGGISIDQPTLSRVYGLHYLLPFVLLGLVILHIVLLHEHGSNNSLGMEKLDLITFHPYFTYKDLLGVLIALVCFVTITLQYPNLLSHSDNYILADPGVTPTHIVPEWYFLPYYAILRSVPNKAGGVCLLLGAILCLLFLPLIVSPLQRSGVFRPLFKHNFAAFVFIWFLLGWSGGNPIETPYYELCLVTVFYFSFFLIFLPVLDFLENLYYHRLWDYEHAYIGGFLTWYVMFIGTVNLFYEKFYETERPDNFLAHLYDLCVIYDLRDYFWVLHDNIFPFYDFNIEEEDLDFEEEVSANDQGEGSDDLDSLELDLEVIANDQGEGSDDIDIIELPALDSLELDGDEEEDENGKKPIFNDEENKNIIEDPDKKKRTPPLIDPDPEEEEDDPFDPEFEPEDDDYPFDPEFEPEFDPDGDRNSDENRKKPIINDEETETKKSKIDEKIDNKKKNK